MRHAMLRSLFAPKEAVTCATLHSVWQPDGHNA